MAEKWGPKEVAEHLQKVREYFKIAPEQQVTLQLIVTMLEDYDVVHPITQDQADAIVEHVIKGAEHLRAQRN
jgi:hypothetical protein